MEAIVNRSDTLRNARESALMLMGDEKKSIDTVDVFDSDSLETVESGIKRLNEFGNKCWLMSSILVFSIIYDKQMYRQSNLLWNDYIQQSKERLGLEARELSEQLSAARFFIRNHRSLVRAGWNAAGGFRKLARAELAAELSGSTKDTIQHLVHDTWAEFYSWYSGFKKVVALPICESPRNDIKIKGRHITINGIEPVKISDDLPEEEQTRIYGYLEQIFEAIKNGYEPAIIPVYDRKEANAVIRYRDKLRREK